jgi:hypothetical protein
VKLVLIDVDIPHEGDHPPQIGPPQKQVEPEVCRRADAIATPYGDGGDEVK